jgi:excisionase family DNA binding protein
VSSEVFYTLQEVAQLCRVSLATVRYWVHTSRIESVRPARHRLVPQPALARFMEKRRREGKRVVAG